MAEQRAKSNSVEAAVKAMADTRKRVEWPEVEVTRLPKPEDAARAQTIFDRIMTSRAPDDWRQHDAVMAANLGNIEVELDKLMVLVSKSGWVVSGGGKHGNTIVRSPLLDPIQHLTTRQLALARALGITGQPADAKTINNAARAITDARNAARGADSLLAGYDDDFTAGAKYAR